MNELNQQLVSIVWDLSVSTLNELLVMRAFGSAIETKKDEKDSQVLAYPNKMAGKVFEKFSADGFAARLPNGMKMLLHEWQLCASAIQMVQALDYFSEKAWKGATEADQKTVVNAIFPRIEPRQLHILITDEI